MPGVTKIPRVVVSQDRTQLDVIGGGNDGGSLSGRLELGENGSRGPTLQIAEIGAVTIDAGCRWRSRNPTSPCRVVLHFFDSLKRKELPAAGGIALGLITMDLEW